MGGEHSPLFEYFKSLLIRGLFEVRKHIDELIILISIMDDFNQPRQSMPCIRNIDSLEKEIRERISGKFNVGPDKKNEFRELVDRIVG